MQLAFHRLARSSPDYAWWRPLVALLIGGGIFVGLSLIVSIGWLVLRIAGQPQLLDDPNELLRPLLELELTDPLTFALATISIAVMLPAVFIARRIMGPRPVGLLSSVTGRLRWRWLLRCIPLALVSFGVVFGVQFLIPAPEGGGEVSTIPVATTALLVVLALILTPLQATAEEYVFRGWLMQTIGGWLRHPAWAILLPVPLFAIGHTQYGLLGLLDVSLFGLAAGYLTWRTGGLEAAIVAHVVNNTTLFVLGAFGLVDNSGGEGSLLGLLSTAVIMGVFTALVIWQANRGGIERTREVLPPQPPPEYWAPPESSLPTVPGRVTEIPPQDSSAPGWPPPPPRPTPIDPPR